MIQNIFRFVQKEEEEEAPRAGVATLPITHWHGLAAVQLARLHSRKGKKAEPPKKEGGT